MKAALVIRDCGDGSATFDFYKNIERACFECEEFNEDTCMNDGEPTIIDVPEGFVPPGGWSE